MLHSDASSPRTCAGRSQAHSWAMTDRSTARGAGSSVTRSERAADEVKWFALSWMDLFLFYSQLVFVFVHRVQY